MGAERCQRTAVAFHRPPRTRTAHRRRQRRPDLPCHNRIDLRDEQARRRRSKRARRATTAPLTNYTTARANTRRCCSRHSRTSSPRSICRVDPSTPRCRTSYLPHAPKGWARASRAGRPTAGSRYCGRRSAFPTSGSSRGISLSAGRAEAMVRFAGVRSPMWCSATAGIPAHADIVYGGGARPVSR